MSYKSIRHWPENERPRERLMQYGLPISLTPSFLRFCSGQEGWEERPGSALELLHTFKNLRNIESASYGEFKTLKGIGPAKIAQIKAALELAEGFPVSAMKRVLNSPRLRMFFRFISSA